MSSYNRAIKKYARTKLGLPDYERRGVAMDLRRMKRQINLNKGELKAYHFSSNATAVLNSTITYVDLTSIGQGDDDDDRTGRKIRVVGIDIRIHNSTNTLDTYIIKSLEDSVPGYGDFDVARGGHLNQGARHEKKEIAYLREYRSTTNNLMYKRRWKTGIHVYYNGTAANNGMKNRLFMVFKNTTGATINVEYSGVVYFYDN